MALQKRAPRGTSKRFQHAYLAALAVEDWPAGAFPVTIDFRRFRNAQYRTVRGVPPTSTDWHVTISAKICTKVLGDWQSWHLYASEARSQLTRWNALKKTLALRLDAISSAAWETGIRRVKVTFDGTDGLTAHQVIALEAEADKWLTAPPDQDSNLDRR